MFDLQAAVLQEGPLMALWTALFLRSSSYRPNACRGAEGSSVELTDKALSSRLRLEWEVFTPWRTMLGKQRSRDRLTWGLIERVVL